MEAPAPRLEFRWRKEPEDDQEREQVERNGFGETYFCDYGLVMPLQEHDIRREDENGNKTKSEAFFKFGTTARGATTAPEDGDVPYRDSAHASWDSAALSGLPVWVKAYSGHHAPRPEKP